MRQLVRTAGRRRAGSAVLLAAICLLPVSAPVAPVVVAAEVVSGRAAPAGPRGGFVLPMAGQVRVLTAFRPPAQRWGPGHRGVDLAAGPGTVIRAAASGVVAFAGTVAGRPVLSIRHTTTLRTTYEPVIATVSVGDTVAGGTAVGLLLAGHQSCAPDDCLHWGARIGADHYLDPMMLLSGLRVRLKPWDP